MPCTALEINKEGIAHKVKFITQQNEKYLVVFIYGCNNEFIPYGNPELTASDMTEEEYHKKLRLEANKNGQFIKEQSTDPEWNPNYNKQDVEF